MDTWHYCRDCRFYGNGHCEKIEGKEVDHGTMTWCEHWKTATKTNLDRIRDMTAEKLAVWKMKECPPKHGLCDCTCAKCWLDWLNREAEE